MPVEASAALTGLEPRSFWVHIEMLTKISRRSRHEEPVIEHVTVLAVVLDLVCKRARSPLEPPVDVPAAAPSPN